jgi:hypothetical protein
VGAAGVRASGEASPSGRVWGAIRFWSAQVRFRAPTDPCDSSSGFNVGSGCNLGVGVDPLIAGSGSYAGWVQEIPIYKRETRTKAFLLLSDHCFLLWEKERLTLVTRESRAKPVARGTAAAATAVTEGLRERQGHLADLMREAGLKAAELGNSSSDAASAVLVKAGRCAEAAFLRNKEGDAFDQSSVGAADLQ